MSAESEKESEKATKQDAAQELHATVRGRVQGVLFRRTVQSYAQRAGLRGFVRNTPDGSVEICAQGTQEQLDALLAWLRSGPGFTNVTDIGASWHAAEAQHDGFTIQKDQGLVKDQLQSMRNLGRSLLRPADAPVAATPRHVAIIPDGNRRWAKRQGLISTAGHARSTESTRVTALLDEAKRLGITHLTIWGFSTENWKRSPEECAEIFRLVGNVLVEFRAKAQEHKTRFRCFGRRDRLPDELVERIEAVEQETANYTETSFSLCLDYGGRDELLRAVHAAIEKGEEVDEQSIAAHLDTAGLPDPDLIIRTGGEQRLSGFMAWQSVYAELYFTDTFFPDFGPEQLREAVQWYGKRVRRFGGDDPAKK